MSHQTVQIILFKGYGGGRCCGARAWRPVECKLAAGAGGNGGAGVVGVDEAEPLAGKISWISPVARALIKSRVGDVVKLAVPGGLQELDVLSVRYPEPT